MADIERPCRSEPGLAVGRNDKPEPDHHRAERHRPAYAIAVSQIAHADPTDAGTKPGEGGRERWNRARSAHFGCDRFQGDHRNPWRSERHTKDHEREARGDPGGACFDAASHLSALVAARNGAALG